MSLSEEAVPESKDREVLIRIGFAGRQSIRLESTLAAVEIPRDHPLFSHVALYWPPHREGSPLRRIV